MKHIDITADIVWMRQKQKVSTEEANASSGLTDIF